MFALDAGISLEEIAVVDRKLQVIPTVAGDLGLRLDLAGLQGRLGGHGDLVLEVRGLAVALAVLLDVLGFRGQYLVEALVVVDPPGVRGRVVVQSVVAPADLDLLDLDHRKLAFDLYRAPAIGDQLGLQGGEGVQAFPGGLTLEDQPRLMFLSVGLFEVAIEAFGEFLGDDLGVLAVAHGFIPPETFEGRMQEDAESCPVEFDVAMGCLSHAESVFEPEVGRVRQVVLEAGRGDALP